MIAARPREEEGLRSPAPEDQADSPLLVVTGFSGAGKSLTIRILEDFGYFCVDNLPPDLLSPFSQLATQSGGRGRRLAVVMDVRGGEFFDRAVPALDELDRQGVHYTVLFLEASEEVLVHRFKETRRVHPLAEGGRLIEGIRRERARLAELRGRAHRVIDTSDVRPSELREELRKLLAPETEGSKLVITVVSFGFKYGLPRDADLVFDVRFLPNPHYVPTLSPLPGTDPAVRRYVLERTATSEFLAHLMSLLQFLLPQYLAEGKGQLSIAIGCTGGRHRSVVVAEELTEKLRAAHFPVVVEHRDVGGQDLDREAR